MIVKARALVSNNLAAVWMCVAVMVASWWPLVIATLGSVFGPFQFAFFANGTTFLVWYVTVAVLHPDLLSQKEVWVAAIRELFTLRGVLATFNGFATICYVAATLFVDTALVFIVAGGWLLMFVVFQKFSDRRGRYSTITRQGWVMLVVAMLGMSFVTLSQTGGLDLGSDMRLLWGVLLAAATAVSLSCISCRLQIGSDLHLRYSAGSAGFRQEVAYQLIISMLANVPGLVVAAVFGFTVGAGLFPALGSVFFLMFLAGVATFSSVAFRFANVITRSLGVNAIEYARPVLAVLWLGLFSTITLLRVDMFLLGASAVVAANVLIALSRNLETGVLS